MQRFALLSCVGLLLGQVSGPQAHRGARVCVVARQLTARSWCVACPGLYLGRIWPGNSPPDVQSKHTGKPYAYAWVGAAG
jgi:hypothetical protein